MNRATPISCKIAFGTLVVCLARVSEASASDQPAEQFRAAAKSFFANVADGSESDSDTRQIQSKYLRTMENSLNAMRASSAPAESIAFATHKLGEAYFASADYRRAIVHLQQAAAEYEKMPGRAGNAALMKCRIAELSYRKAASAAHRATALKALEDAFSQLCRCKAAPEQIAEISGNLGSRLCVEFRYDGALKYLSQAEQFYAKLPREGKPRAVHLRTALADCYMGLGDNTKALEVYQSALSLAIDLHGEEDLRTADVQRALGRQLLRMSRPAESIKPLSMAWKTKDKLLNSTHLATIDAEVDMAHAILGYSDYLRVRGETKRSQELLDALRNRDVPVMLAHADRAQSLHKRSFHPWAFSELHFVVATVYHRLGEIGRAREHYTKALEGWGKNLDNGTQEPDNMRELLLRTKSACLAVLEAKARKPAEAGRLFGETCSFLRRHALSVLPGLPESQVLMFLHTQHFVHLHSALSMVYLYGDSRSVVEQTAEWVVNGKGLALDVSNVRFGKPDRPAAWLSLDQVRRALPADTVLVDVLKLKPLSLMGNGSVYCWATEPNYLAWVIPAIGEGDVRVFDLGPAKSIDDEVNRLLSILDDSQEAISRDGAALHEKRTVWPVLNRLSELLLRSKHSLGPAIFDKQRWIVSGDSLLAALPWCALRWNDKYLIETHQIEYVNTSRNVVPSVKANAIGPPLLVAFPDVDLSAEAATQKRSELLQSTSSVPTGSTAESLGFAAKFEAIQRNEGLLVAMSVGLLGYCGERPRQYCDANAVEAAFYATRQPRAIAFVGHGAAVATSAAGKGPRQGWVDSLAVSASDLHDPFTQCALVLAGANHRHNGQTRRSDDGLLLGAEIARLDLSGTQLVVLIACVSNRGEVRNGEGLASLRQAFHVAGAGAVIGTHWNVPTAETLALTRLFWGQLRLGLPPSQALRQAQLETMASCRANAKDQSSHPWYWAGLTYTSTGRIMPLTKQNGPSADMGRTNGFRLVTLQ